MFGTLGPNEIIIIGIVLVLLFGGNKLKELARGAGESTRELKKVKKEFTNTADDFSKAISLDSSNENADIEGKVTKATKKLKYKKGGKTSV